ncbi:DMT family transporter [Salipaludibacillus sp. CF4.18]|uniref:DMT family transporter n=1 Tax=Salipaludibacillus sp. CF4.18 TaxID=3373081 RepID=UPI003EE70030
MRLVLLYTLLVITMCVWGFNVIAIKVLVTTFPTLTITTLRVFIAFLSILPFILIKKSWKRMSKRDGLFLLGISLTTILGHQFFMSVGLNHTSAVNGGLILGTVPIVTSVAAAIFLQEKFNIHKVIGILFGFVGVVIIMLAGSRYTLSINLGDLLFICTVIVQAIGFVFVKKISDNIDILLITGVSQLLGSMMLFGLSQGLEPDGLSALDTGTWKIWLIFIFSSVVATGIGHFLYNVAIRELGAGKSAIFLNLTPFFSILGSYLFLNESIEPGHWIGLSCVIIGVLFGSETLNRLVNFEKV